jgi:uncharacterized protein (UPF0248 family)
MTVVANSVDDDCPELSVVARRGYGGLAIFWKKEIDDKIKVMDEGHSRIQVIQIDTNASSICLINVYMPSDNKEIDCEYKDMISQLSEVIAKYRNTHEIVICGEMNGSAHRDKTSHDSLFKNFLLENRIGLSIHYPEKDTCYHHNEKSSGQIDYIISTCKNILKKVEIMDMDPTNTSDHVPMIAQIKRKLVRRAYKPKTTIVKTKWEKCDLNTYQSTITDGVVQSLQNSNINIEEDIIAMEEIMHTACDKTIPNYRKCTIRKPTGKSIWNNNIAEATKNAKFKYNQWRNAGKPKGRENLLKSQQMVAKRLLRKAQRQAYASQRECLARNIMTASSSDTILFHYLLRRQRYVEIQHTRILQYNDQVAETHEDILALWQKYFQDLSNPDFKQDFDYEKYDLSHIYRMPL